MFTVSLTTIALYGMAILLAVLIGRDFVKWLLKEDQEIVARRKHAAQLAAKLQSFGLIVLPKMLTEYSTGDYVGLVEEIDNQVTLFLGPNGDANLMKELQASFDSVLAAQLKDPAGYAYITAKIAAMKSVGATAAPAAAAPAAAAPAVAHA